MFKPRFAHSHRAGWFFPAIGGAGLVGGTIYYRAQHRSAAAAPDTKTNAAHSRKQREEGLSGAGIGQTATSGGHETGQIGSGVNTVSKDPERKINSDVPLEKLPGGGVGGGVGGGGANVRAVEMNSSGPKGYGSDNSSVQLDAGSGESSKGSSDNKPSDSTPESSSGSGESKNSSSSKSTSDNTKPSTGESSTKSVDVKQLSKSYPPSTKATPKKGDTDKNTRISEKPSASQRLQGFFGQGGKTAGGPGENTKKYHDTRVHSNLPEGEVPTKRGKMRSDS